MIRIVSKNKSTQKKSDAQKTNGPQNHTWKDRRAGVLMPIFSLPNDYGIGAFGQEAYDFVSFLAQTGVSVWQILPLTPTGYGDSPYQSVCSYALNYYFIDLETLKKQGYLTAKDLENAQKNGDFQPLCTLACGGERIDYQTLFLRRLPLLKKAYSRFIAKGDDETSRFFSFVEKGEYYDFALFMSLKETFDFLPFSDWGNYAEYSEEKATSYAKAHTENMLFWQFTQYIFLSQWQALRAYANGLGVEILGDMPMYVASDSVEMWKYGKTLFETDEKGAQTQKAGVPPDAFSADGQLWGNPVYRWNDMKKDGYSWWKGRIERAFDLYDMVRIDHFRAFDRYYSIDGNAQTAREGEWLDGPKESLFAGMKNKKIIAEDLGLIDDGVRALMQKVGYPGMRVLEFAFDGNENNTNKPSNSPENSVMYTGTHDNMPFAEYVAGLDGWARDVFANDFAAECQKAGFETHAKTPQEYTLDAVRLAFASTSFLCVVPFQELIAIGSGARINAPSVLSTDNWSFRFTWQQLYQSNAKKILTTFCKKYKRIYKAAKEGQSE